VQSETSPAIAKHRRGLVGLEQRVLARWRADGGGSGATVVVGFSGGADSLALAALLGRLADRGGPRPVLVHVDHGLRAASAAEAEHAAELAASLALPLQIRRLSADPRTTHPGVGLEEAARRERYRAIAEVVAERGALAVALAHHREDQAETVLLHLLRGAGLAGAAGMAGWTRLDLPWWDDRRGAAWQLSIWRPLLDEAKATVRAYADRLGLEPIVDPTNEDCRLRRNALRHEILPALEQVVPGASAALTRFATLAAAEDAYLADAAAAAYRRAVTATGDLSRRALAGEPVALRRRVIRRWLREFAPTCSPTADRTDALLELIDRSESGRAIEIGNHVTVRVLGSVARVGCGVTFVEGGERGG
jgi:tRNA(Ile)-lysidine synthetase-like protein